MELNGSKILVRYPDRNPTHLGIAKDAQKAQDLPSHSTYVGSIGQIAKGQYTVLSLVFDLEMVCFLLAVSSLLKIINCWHSKKYY